MIEKTRNFALKLIYSTLLLVLPLSSFANTIDKVEMADVMRSEGKIYVVVSVLAIIFAGLFFLLIRIEKKLNKIEKDI